MMENEIMEIINYIRDREESLSHYSDKLRQALVRISNFFSDPQGTYYCCLCGHDKSYHNTHQVPHQFIPRIHVSVDFEGDTFYSEKNEDYDETIDYHLCIFEDELQIAKRIRGELDTQYIPFSAAPRRILKQIIRQKALVPFFQQLAEKLERLNLEYKEVTMIAEKLAMSLQATA